MPLLRAPFPVGSIALLKDGVDPKNALGYGEWATDAEATNKQQISNIIAWRRVK